MTSYCNDVILSYRCLHTHYFRRWVGGLHTHYFRCWKGDLHIITSGVGRATCILITSLVGCLATCYDVIAACILITSVPGWGVIYYYVWFMLFLWPPSFVENYSTCCSRHSVYVLNNGFISRKFSKNLYTFAYFCHHTAIYSFSN